MQVCRNAGRYVIMYVCMYACMSVGM
jgi:hypothetical protein